MSIKTLAAALAVIGREDAELEAKAMQVLRIVRAKKINDLKAWNRAVREAYKANGWNALPGKPKAEAKTSAVPATVKQYVSAIRRAYRLKLLVSSYSSMHALRQDLKKHAVKAQRKADAAEKRQPPELIGIRLQQPDVLTGGIFHDLAALYNALDRTKRPQMISALSRVKRDFSMAAPQLVVASLPETSTLRKAA